MIRVLLCFWICACGSSGGPGKSVEELFEHYRIASSPGSLSIPEEAISDEDLVAILEDSRTPSLTSIELSKNEIGNPGLTQLLQSSKTTGLRFLNLAHNRLDDESARILAQSPRLETVESLLLAGNDFSAEGIRHLAESPYLTGLRILSLGGQSLGSDSAVHLTQIGPLQTLDLTASDITARGASVLFANSQTQNLLLQGNPLQRDSFSLERFSKHLVHLDLRSCGLGAPQVEQLKGVASGTALSTMNLSKNPLMDEGLHALGMAEWLKNLKKLEAYESQSSLDARSALRESWGRRGGLKVETR